MREATFSLWRKCNGEQHALLQDYNRDSSVTNMTSTIGLQSLEERRAMVRLTLMYKIVHDLVDISTATLCSLDAKRVMSSHLPFCNLIKLLSIFLLPLRNPWMELVTFDITQYYLRSVIQIWTISVGNHWDLSLLRLMPPTTPVSYIASERLHSYNLDLDLDSDVFWWPVAVRV